MAELAPSGGGPNRLFIILAIFLGGLLVLGLLGLGGYYVLQRFLAPSPVAIASTPTIRPANTPTRVLATATLAPTDIPSPTFVLGIGATSTPGGAAPLGLSGGTITATMTTFFSTPGYGTPGYGTIGYGTPGYGTPGSGNLPQTGLGEDLLMLAGGIVLIMIVFAARRARSGGAA
jgi:hypothetical protein